RGRWDGGGKLMSVAIAEQADEFLASAPPVVDVEAVRRACLALAPPYDVNTWQLPWPLWARRTYEDSGPRAWEILRADLAQPAAAAPPMCIYLHVPFCAQKCGFCDSYSFKLGAHQADHFQRYVDRLCYELRLWSAQANLRHRPVSTVHMGGGTPTFLGEAG